MMADDELHRDPPRLLADFIEHTRDACWDLQFYAEWCYTRGVEPALIVLRFTNVLVAFRGILRELEDPAGQPGIPPDPMLAHGREIWPPLPVRWTKHGRGHSLRVHHVLLAAERVPVPGQDIDDGGHADRSRESAPAGGAKR